MTTQKEIDKFISSQQSIHLYKNVQESLKYVLSCMSDDEYKKVTKNLILMVLHEGAYGQVMHFERKGKFQIIQLTIPKKIPIWILRYIIAHEFGHVLQERNWKKSDGQKLEEDANAKAKRWGFTRTPKMERWMIAHYKRVSQGISIKENGRAKQKSG